MKSNRKNPVVIAGASILIVAFAVMAIFGLTKGRSKDAVQLGPLEEVHGVVGSEKKAFFDDPKVQEAFRKHDLKVTVETSGSWEMSERDGIEQEDFASPSSDIAAQHLEDAHRKAIKSTSKPFYSPMAIGSFENILEILQKNGMASQTNGQWNIDMAKYLDLVSQNKKWTDLQGSDSYPSQRNVLITSTDVRSSNSAGMYLALAVDVMNGNVPPDTAASKQYVDKLSSLFIDQGYSQESSAGPWENYLDKGPSLSPMVMMYEAQYLETKIQEPDRMKDAMRIAYINPDVIADHNFISFSDKGSKVSDLLSNDEELATLLAEHGFRINGKNSGVFDKVMKQHKINVMDSASFTNVTTTPSYETMQYLIGEIAKRYQR